MSVAVREDLEVRDGIRHLLKGRINGEGSAELFPKVPLCRGGGGSRRNNSKGDRCLRSAEIADESMVGERW